MRKLLITIALFLLLGGAENVYAQCFNVNLNIQGTINQDPSCPGPPEIEELRCLVGNTLSTPSYDIRIITDNIIPHPTLSTIHFSSAQTTITAPNGATIDGTNSIVSTAVDGMEQVNRTIDILTLTNGIGVFTDISGILELDSNLNLTNSTFTSVMKGQVCFNVN